MKEDVEKTKAIGMIKHLNKPIDVEKLYETLLEYISKKTNKIEKATSKEDGIILPEFEHIDKEYALKLVLENKKIFINTLKGLYEYKNIDLKSMDDDEFKRVVHTIKGISASAGALKLNQITKELEETGDKNYLNNFYTQLNKVVNEIEQKIINTKITTTKIELTKEKSEELFAKLKEAVVTKRAKNCKPIIEEFEKYNLVDKDKKLYNEVKGLIKKFKFKNALELL
jgi:HPt (histidine-containing phosphotransfer) domain-containing protein